MTDEAAMNLIANLLDGKPWTPDTLDEIAEIVRTTTREVRDVNDFDPSDVDRSAVEHLDVRPDGPETERGGLIGQQPY